MMRQLEKKVTPVPSPAATSLNTSAPALRNSGALPSDNSSSGNEGDEKISISNSINFSSGHERSFSDGGSGGPKRLVSPVGSPRVVPSPLSAASHVLVQEDNVGLESPDTRLAKLRARKKEFMRKYELRMKRRITPPSPVPLPALTRARAATSPDLSRRDPAPIRPSPLLREMMPQGLESPGGEEINTSSTYYAYEKDPREKEKEEEELYDVVRARSSDDEDSEGFDGSSSTEEEELDDDDEWEAEAERIFMT